MDKHKRTVLFVDDDASFLHDLTELMQKSGYRIITKTNGPAALSMLDEGVAVDVVVIDYLMPGMDGLEFIAAVKKRTQSLPIVLLTAHGDVDTYFKALCLGAYEIMYKPISMSAVQSVVKAAIIYGTAGGNKVCVR
jgi:two-component system response regulator (stage 0 sporulation protein F)